MDMGDVTTEGAPDRGQGSRLRIDHRSGSCMDMALTKHHIQVCCVFQFLVSSGSDDCKCRRRWQIGVFGRVEGKSRSESRGFCCTCNLDDAGMEGAIKSRGSARIGSRRLQNAMQWPPPPSTPHPFPVAERVILEWGRSQGLGSHKLEILAGLLRRCYLAGLPLPRLLRRRATALVSQPRQCRHPPTLPQPGSTFASSRRQCRTWAPKLIPTSTGRL